MSAGTTSDCYSSREVRNTHRRTNLAVEHVASIIPLVMPLPTLGTLFIAATADGKFLQLTVIFALPVLIGVIWGISLHQLRTRGKALAL